MKKGYTTELKLEHDEIALKGNVRTGEISEIAKRPNNIPEGKEIFEPNARFKKDYTQSLSWVRKSTTAIELQACMGLILMAKSNSNSLEPLNRFSSIRDLSYALDMSINKVGDIMYRLEELGVFATFRVMEADKRNEEIWVLNPYLSFAGRIVSSDLANLFKNTHIARAFRDRDYPVNPPRVKREKLHHKKVTIMSQ